MYRILIIFVCVLLYSCNEGFNSPDILRSSSDAKFKVAPFCYPNPIHEGEKINLFYEISDTCFVNVYMTNLAGDVVKKIYNNQKNRKGKHDIEIQTENEDNVQLGSGIYSIKVELDSEVEKSVLFEIRK